MWVHDILGRERLSGRIKLDPPVFASLIGSFDYIQNCNRRIFNHGWVNFPLGRQLEESWSRGHDQEVVGSNPTVCWAFLSFYTTYDLKLEYPFSGPSRRYNSTMKARLLINT